MAQTNAQTVMSMLKKRGVIRARDLVEQKIPRTCLRRMVESGELANPERGLYVLADASTNLNQSLMEASSKVPQGVICLLSALQFHGLTTQAPFEVWMAIGGSARKPTVHQLPLRIVRFTGRALSDEIVTHTISGVPVRIYSPAKTVADCFKYRNKIGIDVALEALRDCWKKRKATMDEIYRAAAICRVSRVMRPYLESLT